MTTQPEQQPEPCPQQEPLSANLAKRLAEAADGFRDDKFYYFVCKRKFPFGLDYVRGNSDAEARKAADIMLAEKNSGITVDFYEKFGPYKTGNIDQTQSDPNQTPGDCEPSLVYDKIEIRYFNGDTLADTPSQYLDGNVDAIVLNISAYDKFYLPYYTRLYGVDIARDMRRAAIKVLSANPPKPVPHQNHTIAKKIEFTQ